MRRVIPILLVLTVLMPSVAMAAEWYRCGADRELRASCCCPTVKAKPAHRAPAETATIRRTPCCEVDLAAPVDPGTARPPEPAFAAPAPMLIPTPVSPAWDDATAVARVVVDVPAARVPTGPPEPIFVRHCALLL